MTLATRPDVNVERSTSWSGRWVGGVACAVVGALGSLVLWFTLPARYPVLPYEPYELWRTWVSLGLALLAVAGIVVAGSAWAAARREVDTTRPRPSLLVLALVGWLTFAALVAQLDTFQDSRRDANVAASALDGFEVVGEIAVGLNGRENDGRPPLEFLLLTDAEGEASEAELVDRYVSRLRDEGWDMVWWAEADDWWTAEGNDGVAFVRVGPASRFHDLASIAEGYSRTRFRELAAENPGPLIVVSVDPAG